MKKIKKYLILVRGEKMKSTNIPVVNDSFGTVLVMLSRELKVIGIEACIVNFPKKEIESW